MSEPTIDQVVDMVEQHIETFATTLFNHMRSEGAETHLMVHLIGTDENGEIVNKAMIDSTDDKSLFMREVRAEAERINAVWAATMSEAWTVTVANLNAPTMAPSEHPDRRECFILVVEGPLGARMVQWMVEGAGKEATLTQRTEVTNFTGRFARVLPPKLPAEPIN